MQHDEVILMYGLPSHDVGKAAEQTNARIGAVQRRFYGTYCKRPLDIIIVLLMLPLVLPVLLILVALTKCDGGPAFYVQDRVGRAGRPFRCWKLRTMVPDADSRLRDYLAQNEAARNEWAVHQKLRDDPRVTPIGRIIRGPSLDELPQLLNVLKGDMSLVGPRPIMPSQLQAYPGTAYFRIRPGITGPWQVSERNSTAFSDRADYDAAYEARISFAADLGLLVRTVLVVLAGTGY